MPSLVEHQVEHQQDSAHPNAARAVTGGAPDDLRANVIFRRPDASETIDVLGNSVRLALGGRETADAFSLTLYSAAPQSGPPLHRHTNGDELFIVLDDGLEFSDGSQWVPVPAGTVVLIPKLVVHTFRNASAHVARTWVLSAPAGFDVFMRNFAALLQQTAPEMPEASRITALYAAHGVETVS